MIEAGRNTPVEETAGFALAKACRAHRANVGAALAGVGLHVGQEMVLLELWKEDGLRGGELAARLRVEPPTVTRMLQRLEGCGLVERRKDTGDARSFRVCLTEKGRALEGPVGITAAAHVAQALPPPSADAGLAHGLATEKLFTETCGRGAVSRGPELHLSDRPGLGVELDEAAIESRRL